MAKRDLNNGCLSLDFLFCDFVYKFIDYCVMIIYFIVCLLLVSFNIVCFCLYITGILLLSVFNPIVASVHRGELLARYFYISLQPWR